jgi:hypothetical protein
MRAPLPYKPPDRHRYKRSGSRFAAAKTPTKKLPSARGRLLEIHLKTVRIPPQRKYTKKRFGLL